jgi:hypothetical protein
MVKVPGPLLSLQAHGWFGRWAYGAHGVVKNPYPIALLPKLRLWDRTTSLGTALKYWVPAFGLHPYPSFIAAYYSRLGWTYQMRRTWHGITWSAIHPPISAQPNTALQYAYKLRFADGVHLWQSMSDATKNIYHHWTYPVHATRYGRFMHWFLEHTPVTAVVPAYYLLEEGGKYKAENDVYYIQE